MNDVERIYSLLVHSKGLKTRDISNELDLDKYYVAEILLSTDNIPYWYQDDDFLWFAKEGALKIEEKVEDPLTTPLEIPKKINVERFLQDKPSESLRSYVNKLSHFRTYSESNIKELILRYRDGDLKAFNMLVKSQQKLVAGIALIYKKECVQLEDLIQEGNIGLLTAINRYDCQNYNNFVGYAKSWIMQAILYSMTILPYHVRLPLNQLSVFRKLQRFIDKFEQINEIPPSVYDIDIGEEIELKRLTNLCQLPSELEKMTCLIDDFDVLADNTNLPDIGLIKESTRYNVLKLVHALPEREKDILVEFYGLNGKEEKTLEEIGSLYGLTRERVRQIKEKSIRKLRLFLKAVKDKDIEDNSSYLDMESRWKGTHGNQFSSLESPKLYTEAKEKPIKVSRNTKGRNKNPFREIFNVISSQLEINRANNIPDLKHYILQVFKQTPHSLTSYEVYLEVARLLPNENIRKESVEYLLHEMPEVDCTRSGWYQIKKESSTGSMISNKSHTISTINYYKKEDSRDYEVFSLSTPLNELVKFKILTRKDCKSCRRKGLFTIGDVKTKIQEYNLTPDSTRFTQYSIKMWFKIVGLLESNTSQKNIKEKKDITLNNHPQKLEEIYKKYTQKILRIRQAKIKGKVIIAKPALILAVLNGIDDGVFSNNRILLNDWLVNRYNKLMGTYNNNTSITEIGMPFWHLQHDGFWHLQFIGILKEKVYTPTRKWLNNNVEYAYFDNDLWLLLQDKEWRIKLRNFILDHKLPIIVSEHTQEKAKKTVQEKAHFEDSVNSFDDLEIEYVKVDSHGKVIGTSSSADEKIHQMGDRSSNKRGKPWTENEEKTLTYFFKQGSDVATIAKLLRRTEVAIKSRLGKLGLINYTYGQDEEKDTVLRVTFKNGYQISEEDSSIVFYKTIKEIGPQLVNSLGIIHKDLPLIHNHYNDEYDKLLRPIGYELYLMIPNTIQEKRFILEMISAKLKLRLEVEEISKKIWRIINKNK